MGNDCFPRQQHVCYECDADIHCSDVGKKCECINDRYWTKKSKNIHSRTKTADGWWHNVWRPSQKEGTREHKKEDPKQFRDMKGNKTKEQEDTYLANAPLIYWCSHRCKLKTKNKMEMAEIFDRTSLPFDVDANYLDPDVFPESESFFESQSELAL